MILKFVSWFQRQVKGKIGISEMFLGHRIPINNVCIYSFLLLSGVRFLWSKITHLSKKILPAHQHLYCKMKLDFQIFHYSCKTMNVLVHFFCNLTVTYTPKWLGFQISLPGCKKPPHMGFTGGTVSNCPCIPAKK